MNRDSSVRMGVVKPNLVDFAFDCISCVVYTAVVFRWIMFFPTFLNVLWPVDSDRVTNVVLLESLRRIHCKSCWVGEGNEVPS